MKKDEGQRHCTLQH